MDSSYFSAIVDAYFPEPQASLLNGIILGIPLTHQPELNEIFKKTGIIHIVVLSGSNISILCAFILTFTRSAGRNASIVITILALIFFIGIVRPQAPIIRAFIMNVFTFASIIFGRPSNGIYVLILTAVISAIIWPEWITSLSFHLSYAATLGLLLFASIEKKKDVGHPLYGYFMQELRISLAAQVFTVPLLFATFRQISLISPFSNIAISFTIAPLMVLGYFFLIATHIHPVLGELLAIPCYGLLTFIISTTSLFAKLPGGFVEF